MKKISLLALLLLLGSAAAIAQNDLKGVVYDREFTAELKGHTNGFALVGNYGKTKTYYKTSLLQFELLEIKHPREVRQSFEFFNAPLNTQSKAFIFGKQNNFYALHVGWGGKRLLTDRAKEKGVAVGLVYAAGPSLGMLKPYYLQLRYYEQDGRFRLTEEKYSAENAATFLNLDRIYGGAGFAYGLNEISLLAGGHAKVGLHLDWGAFEELAKGLEVGAMLDVYAKEVPIMVTEVNSPIFLNFYISAFLGKRW